MYTYMHVKTSAMEYQRPFDSERNAIQLYEYILHKHDNIIFSKNK